VIGRGKNEFHRSSLIVRVFMTYTGDPYEIVSHLESLGEAEVRRLLGTREFGDPGSITRSVVEG